MNNSYHSVSAQSLATCPVLEEHLIVLLDDLRFRQLSFTAGHGGAVVQAAERAIAQLTRIQPTQITRAHLCDLTLPFL